jgi:hypothetical protein
MVRYGLGDGITIATGIKGECVSGKQRHYGTRKLPWDLFFFRMSTCIHACTQAALAGEVDLYPRRVCKRVARLTLSQLMFERNR